MFNMKRISHIFSLKNYVLVNDTFLKKWSYVGQALKTVIFGDDQNLKPPVLGNSVYLFILIIFKEIIRAFHWVLKIKNPV